MRIAFGLHLDGLQPEVPRTRAGAATLGPRGLLEVLETQLGLRVPAVHPSEAAFSYLKYLRDSNSPDRFYRRSLDVDEVNVARTLLDWREQWYEAGWDGTFPDGAPGRLADMAAVEGLAVDCVPPSVGERLRRVAETLSERTTQIEHVELHTPFEDFPHAWQRVLEVLPCTPSPSLEIAALAPADSDLACVQTRLLKMARDELPGGGVRETLKGDGSLIVVKAASLERYAGALGPIEVSRIATADVMQVLAPHWHSVPAAADTARRRISTVLQWAIGQGYRSDDPAAKRAVAAALGAQTHRTEHHRAMSYAEVAQAVAAVHAKSRRSLPALALEFMILTATRSNEARGATWSEIDLDARTWTIPPGRMKAKRTHRVPLSGRAMAILDEARTLGPATGDTLVFPGTSKGRPLAGATLLNLLARAGLDTTLHGFRSAFANWARERTNVPTAVAEAALAHTVNNAAEAAYARTDYFDKRVDLMERWARFIAAADVIAVEDSREAA